MWGTLGLLIASAFFLYHLVKLFLTWNHNYWPKRGVGVVYFSEIGTLWELFTKKKSIIQIDELYYKKTKEKFGKYGGAMEFQRPILNITDLDLVKQILVKDFDYFADRRDMQFETEPIFGDMLVSLKGEKWKAVRSVLSPAFTSGKMKIMFEHFNKCGKGFVACVQNQQTDECGAYVGKVPELVTRFAVDVIGATAFGMDTKALTDSESHFLKMARRVSEISPWRLFKNMLLILVPRVANALKLRIMDPEMMDFFTGILHSALRNREQSSEKRNDLLQLLVEARKGDLKTEQGEQLDSFEKDAEIKEGSAPLNRKELFTDKLTMAQSFVFFIAGFDTVGALISSATYLLALHPEIQEKVYQEVKDRMDENGEIEYEAVSKLEYMDMFISEILRRYPPANRLERKCLREYKLPGTDLTIPKDMIVAISVQGIHQDPDYYPNPEKFDPERFTPENKAKRHPYAYLAFGQGPRNCIGMRFALIETKIALAYLVYNFNILPTPNTPIPFQIDKSIGINRPSPDLELKFSPRSH